MYSLYLVPRTMYLYLCLRLHACAMYARTLASQHFVCFDAEFDVCGGLLDKLVEMLGVAFTTAAKAAQQLLAFSKQQLSETYTVELKNLQRMCIKNKIAMSQVHQSYLARIQHGEAASDSELPSGGRASKTDSLQENEQPRQATVSLVLSESQMFHTLQLTPPGGA